MPKPSYRTIMSIFSKYCFKGTSKNCLFAPWRCLPRARVLMYYVYTAGLRAVLPYQETKTRIFRGTLISFLALAMLPLNAEEKSKPKPNIQYLIDGQIVPSWHVSLGDPSNWYQPLSERKAESKSKKLSIKPIDYKAKGDALLLDWSRKQESANFAINGGPIDISAFEKNAALLIELKVFKKNKASVSLSMDCSYPCRGTIELKPFLKQNPVNEWFILPIPLSCFAQAGTDLSKVTSPIHLQTEGKLKMALANVQLTSIPKELNFCLEETQGNSD